ncbi:MAG: ribosomal protein S18-alanine N-acetyltransferase [Candidatus Thiodiazotropha sp. (ex Monitilora ramsayi)]|nr:ribosomal protein S18-alanine N-acetyltransferase [Candidatus Thiodiazotropha sp. (ex Monitilora ramsayi)]
MSALLRDPLLSLRPMQQEDLQQVIAIEEAVYPFPWTLGIFQDCLRVGYCCWVILLEEVVIGYGVMSVVIDESHILNLCIHPKWQRKGLGNKLIRRLLKIARQHGAETTFLEVRASNRAAIKLYQGLGFVEVGMRKDYYPAAGRTREDAVVMSLEL